MSELIPLSIHKIMQSKAYTLFILEGGNKKFAIYTAPSVGVSIQSCVTEGSKQRPFTYDLITAITNGLNIEISQIVIYDVQETIYFAKLYLMQQIGEEKHVVEIDARPSDCFTLALMNKTPLYCEKNVLERVINIDD